VAESHTQLTPRATNRRGDQPRLLVVPPQPDAPASDDAAPAAAPAGRTARSQVRGLVRAAVALACLLGVLTAVLYLYRGTGATLPVLPWFNPFVMTFQALTCLIASALILGRYRVLRDRVSFWIGAGFSVYGIVVAFYVLAWPGLVPNRTSFLADLASTAAWFPALSAVLLTGCLLAAGAVHGPAESAEPNRRWLAVLGAVLGSTVLLCLLVIRFEYSLPPLVLADGTFTPLLNTSNAALILLFTIGAVVSIRAAQRTGDSLPALVAVFQVAAAFVYLWIVIASVRYDLWWYLGRALLTAGALFLLFGLLAEYVGLLRRERDKSGALSARSREIIGIEARLREHFTRLQDAHAELQEADRRKTEFIAMLSHELRNPLATISNALLVMQAHAVADPTLARVRDAAVRQARHLARLLDDLLDVSRIDRGKIALEKEPVDLTQIARNAIDAVQPSMVAKKQALTVSLPASLPLEGDSVRLTQAIANLLHNAATYTPEGGRIELSVQEDDGQAVVRVRDDGIGIASDVLPEIFELFVQADQALDRSHGGLGVGLAVTRSLVELHGGSIKAHSPGLGAGSEFVLRLPLTSNITPD
jgi:signal transduction histidine kinase